MGCKNFLHRNAANAGKNVGKKDEEHICYQKIKANQLFGAANLTDEVYKNDTDKLDFLGRDHEDEASFYRARKKYSNLIINAAKDSCVEAIHGIKEKLKTSIDESYDHERNGSWCTS